MHKHTNVAEKCIKQRISVVQRIRNVLNGQIVLHILHACTQRVVRVKWVAVDVIVASINVYTGTLEKIEGPLNRIERFILLV